MAIGKSKKHVSGPAELYTQGVSLFRQGLYEQAIDALEDIQHQDDLTGQLARYCKGVSHRAMGIEHLSAGKWDQAERQFRQAVSLLGSQADLTSYLASLYARSGRHDLCARQMESAPSSGEHGIANVRKFAQAQWRCGQREQAMMTILAAMRRHVGDAQLHLQLGLFHAASEEFDKAKGSLERAVKGDSSNAEAHYYLGLAAAACGDVILTFRSLHRAMHLCPTNVMIAYQLSLAARAAAAGGYHVVVQLPEKTCLASNTPAQQLANLVTHEKGFMESCLAMPSSELDQQLFETLSGVLRLALSQHENYADLHYLMAGVLDRLGQISEAAEHVSRALQINPDYVAARLLAAKLAEKAGQADQALSHLRQAIKLGADWPDVHCQAGELMVGLRQEQDAKHHLERALQLKAHYPRAEKALAALAA